MNVRVLNGVAVLAAVFSFASLFAQTPARTPSDEDEIIWAGITKEYGRTDDKQKETMNAWRREVGAKCTTCHVVSKDRTKRDAAGNPLLVPDDESKPEYAAARNMALMTQELNQTDFAMAQTPLTCGTCHRGHSKPEAYVPLPLPGHPATAQPAKLSKRQPKNP